ncbi:light-harvesting complex-like protein OHP2, chloroplastic [Heracleum sosnowskyi]|uniref:Light-harvesting complex-like protein OHP2, chloroplastic n=1 Tax=Heracleum sosnowskyi TaxID=360622 RepID=A0AAD8NDN6_9APIA|nr:light-harvesting complex-like protein OHP2, chloroplastic [Heracleum sosnowskyi]KAK1403953.1 light-harvesting complex-like protein OHP2, chloroplastic [Heracleum sosnowskyi]
MSAATAAFPCIKITKPTSQSSSISSSSPTLFRYSSTKPSVVIIRSSQADGPLRRPVATPPVKPTPPSAPSAPPPKPVAVAPAEVENGKKNAVTMEFQRQKAKELQEYFKKKKLEEANQGPFFGFLAKNEISNGRWAMFGFAVGMLTEYATGSDFVDQVKILLSNFGIVDLD